MGMQHVTTTSYMGWDYMQDIAQAWLGIYLADNATFPQISTLKSDNKTYFLDSNLARKEEASPTVINFCYASSSTDFAGTFTSLLNYEREGLRHYALLDSYINEQDTILFFPFNYENATGWEFYNGEHRVQPVAISPVFNSGDMGHWLYQKYKMTKTKIALANIPKNIDEYIIKSGDWEVCSIPNFVSFIIGTPVTPVGGGPWTITINNAFSANSIFLYSDNNGQASLISAVSSGSPISSTTGNNRFKISFEFGQGVTIV